MLKCEIWNVEGVDVEGVDVEGMEVEKRNGWVEREGGMKMWARERVGKGNGRVLVLSTPLLRK